MHVRHTCGPSRRMFGAWLSAVIMAFSMSIAALGVEIKLVDGAVLIGDIESVKDGVVTLHTVHLGAIQIPQHAIVTIDGQPPQNLQETDEVQADELAANIEDEEKAANAESSAAPTEPEKEKNWKLSIDLGLANVTGNTDEQVLNFALLYDRETHLNRFIADTSYYLKLSDSDVSDNKFTAGLRYDWLNPDSRWFAFAQGRFDYDQFESWEQRIAGHAGPGYRIIKKEKLKWDARAGLGVRREFGSSNDDLRFEGLLATSVRWNATDRISLNFQSELYPVLTELEDFRTRTTLNIRYRLEEMLSLAFGLLHEYQSIVDPGSEKNDLRLTLSLGLDF